VRILSGELAPGSHLKEEELAELCGVSRTPVRDALRSLAADFYVSIVPNHGTYVSDWSVADIDDIFTLRGMLEGYAAKRAASRATADQIKTMASCCDDIEQALGKKPTPDIDGFLAANRLLHQTITQAADSERLSLMLGRLVEQPIVVKTAMAYERDELRRSNDHHRELVSAMEARDEKWAEAVMTAHIHAALQNYRRTYQKQSPAD
jgi:DNA-binding GntR family transcriptional regulator